MNDPTRVTLRLDAGELPHGCSQFELQLTQETVDDTLRIDVNGYRLPPGAEDCVEAEIPQAFTTITLPDEWFSSADTKEIVVVVADIENLFELAWSGDTLRLSEVAVSNASGGGEVTN